MVSLVSEMAAMIDDAYLSKLVAAGKSVEWIANRFGCSVEDVKKRLEILNATAAAARKNGYMDLQQAFMGLYEQYRLMGLQMSISVGGIMNPFSSEELRRLVAEALKQPDPVTFLIERAVILKPFSPPDPEQLQKEIARSVQGN